MQVKAHLKNARVTPRKARLVRDLVVGLNVTDALSQLSFGQSKISGITHKLMKSAVANAENNNEIAKDNLRVKEVLITDGIKFKRFQPVSRGMAHAFVKRNSNITVIIEEIVPTTKKIKKKKADIKTLSLEEITAQENEAVDTKDKKSAKTGTVAEGAKEEAHSKMKTKQQGSEKQKTHRRKTI
jgi:large subunit ribosomal protein L22